MLVSVRAMQVAKPVLHFKAPSCGSRAGGFLLGKLSDLLMLLFGALTAKPTTSGVARQLLYENIVIAQGSVVDPFVVRRPCVIVVLHQHSAEVATIACKSVSCVSNSLAFHPPWH